MVERNAYRSVALNRKCRSQSIHLFHTTSGTMDPNDLSNSFQSLGIPKTHATVGLSNLIASTKQYKALFLHRRLPDYGWSDVQIQSLLFLLSTLDTNNKSPATGGGDASGGGGESRWCGVGEREGRVFSSLVAQRHFGLSHGTGRSGDVTEPQPKAAGSTALVKLALALALDALRRGSGLDARGPAAHGILLPLCTGMSMALLLGSLRYVTILGGGAHGPERNIVLWSRIDQKSCFKAISSAGLVCVVVPTKIDGDEVVTDIEAMKAALEQHGDRVLAVITTTSCFAPRVPDSVDEVAKLCRAANVHHIINNAYGLQCTKTCKLINRACVVGRVDAVVCSTDKNFLVPVGEIFTRDCVPNGTSMRLWQAVRSNPILSFLHDLHRSPGGAIIVSQDEEVIDKVGKVYAGRASSSPIVDLFITLLSMGLNGYKRLLTERTTMLESFAAKLQSIAEKYGERLLRCPANTISFGVSLDGLARPKRDDETDADYFQSVARDVSSLGAMLFSRCVSGTRVIPRAETKTMGGEEFVGFGSSTDHYNHAYMTAACAIGVSVREVEEFYLRLDKTLAEFKAKQRKVGAKSKSIGTSARNK